MDTKNRVGIRKTKPILQLEGDLQIRCVDHGMGSLPVVELGDFHESFFLSELIEQELEGDDETYTDITLFGRSRITVELMGE